LIRILGERQPIGAIVPATPGWHYKSHRAKWWLTVGQSVL